MTRPPVLVAALTGRCPDCGQGPLFKGLLEIREQCPVCGLEYRGAESGDGPAVLVLFLVSILVLGFALWVEFRFEPPLWVHVVILVPLVSLLSIGLLRPVKAAFVILQHRNQAFDHGRPD
ncbi:DUF983 domain-containing protein [Zavarzinia sp. CC-PAN008]|uniref:DUF983 domain-containing protein n=1 Tax=Zavarzinia sp. CC-PAN008 TaxID=3243332 RepID=UPI003F748874